MATLFLSLYISISVLYSLRINYMILNVNVLSGCDPSIVVDVLLPSFKVGRNSFGDVGCNSFS